MTRWTSEGGRACDTSLGPTDTLSHRVIIEAGPTRQVALIFVPKKWKSNKKRVIKKDMQKDWCTCGSQVFDEHSMTRVNAGEEGRVLCCSTQYINHQAVRATFRCRFRTNLLPRHHAHLFPHFGILNFERIMKIIMYVLFFLELIYVLFWFVWDNNHNNILFSLPAWEYLSK